MVWQTLEQARDEALSCTRCRLHKGRTQVVWMDGNPQSDLMFIGEGPGFHEDQQGLPFVGPAGKLLDQLLAGVGLTRQDCTIVNVVKCLRYNTMVQLGDGSWERIGRLVRSRYRGTVMSVHSDGRLVPRRVVGWFTSPLGDRRVLKLSYRSGRSRGGKQLGTWLTEDHPVLTDRGWVPAGELRSGDWVATGQGLSDVAWDVVCGGLLGDAYISSTSSYLGFSHSVLFREYALFKADLLKELNPRVSETEVAAVAGGPRAYSVVQVRTLAHKALRMLRRDFYHSQRRVPAWIGEALNPRMLAIWFMDDGYTRIRPGRRPLAEIATCGFPEDDLDILVAGLRQLGLTAKAARGRIYFDVPATQELLELIAPYVPPVMRYKLGPAVADGVPFEPDRFSPEAPRVMYDQILVSDCTGVDSPRTSYFCIDVEETHNFVTSGGVVHNCRPPGNRDPMDDEIESCRPYLEAQLSFIRPRLIVTLGNFATRFVLDRNVSISKVRGQKFQALGSTVVPTFHPAAALHGGGENSPTFEALTQDFQLIKELLAHPSEEQLQPTEQQSLF